MKNIIKHIEIEEDLGNVPAEEFSTKKNKKKAKTKKVKREDWD